MEIAWYIAISSDEVTFGCWTEPSGVRNSVAYLLVARYLKTGKRITCPVHGIGALVVQPCVGPIDIVQCSTAGIDMMFFLGQVDDISA